MNSITILKTILVLSIAILFSNKVMSQGPGNFYFNNNIECDVDVTIYAYDEDCGGVDCGSYVGSYGPITVNANTRINVASGYSGSGNVWGKVYVSYYSSDSWDGTSSCSSGGTSISCGNVDVHWDSCNEATIP